MRKLSALLLSALFLLSGIPNARSSSCFCWTDNDCPGTPSCPGTTCTFTWWLGGGSCSGGEVLTTTTEPSPTSPAPTSPPVESRIGSCSCSSDADCQNIPSCADTCVFPPWGAAFGSCITVQSSPTSPSPISPTKVPTPGGTIRPGGGSGQPPVRAPSLPPVPPPTPAPLPPPTPAPVPPPILPPNGPAVGSGEVLIPSECQVRSLMDLLNRAVVLDVAMAPQWLRLAFHDAGTFDQRSNIGGANGCLLNEPAMRTQKENFNLDLALETLVTVRDVWGVEATSADLIQFAGFFVAVRQRGDPGLTEGKAQELLDIFEWGRLDEPNCNVQWALNLPEFELGTEPISDVARRCQLAGAEIKNKMMDRNGFSDFEATALIGAHTIGLTRNIFGAEAAGPWNENGADDATPNGPVMDNQFHSFLINDIEASTIDEFVQNRSPFTTNFPTWYQVPGDLKINYLDTDIVLAFPSPNTNIHPDFHKFTRLFSQSNFFFMRAFMGALDKMSKLGTQRSELSLAADCSSSVIPTTDPMRAFGVAAPVAPVSFEDMIHASIALAKELLEETAVVREEDIVFLTTPVEEFV